MFGLLPLIVLLLVLSGATAVLLLVQVLSRSAIAAGADDPALQHGLRSIRRRLVGCLAAAAVVLIAGVMVSGALPSGLGLPLALAPGLAASVALLGFVILPSGELAAATSPTTTASSSTMTASLARREPWHYGSRRTFLVPGIVAGAYLGLLAAAAALASPDDDGLMRAFSQTQGDLSSWASPFPGAFYALPLALVTVLLAGTTYAALRRVATVPTLVASGSPELQAVDRRWREIAGRVIVRLATAALLGYAGGTLVFAGSAMHRASDFVVNGGHLTAWGPVGWVAVGLGFIGVLAASVVAGAAVASALSLRDQAIRPPEVSVGQLR